MTETLRSAMSVAEVARAIGETAAIFQVTSVNVTHGSGNSAGREAHEDLMGAGMLPDIFTLKSLA